MKKSIVNLAFLCVIALCGLSQVATCDNLVVEYKNGQKQTIELKYNANKIRSILYQKEIKILGTANSEKPTAKIKIDSKHLESNSSINTENGKSSNQKELNFGNNIKGGWETPNPYTPPSNE